MTMTDTARRLLAKARQRPAALPPLTEKCTECGGKGEIYNEVEGNEYFAALDAAEREYKELHPNSRVGFYGSFEYEHNWKRRQPVEFYGCEECSNYSGQRLTPAGRQIMDLVRAHLPK
jgi:glycerophosphoryl diester phosphodiesterase